MAQAGWMCLHAGRATQLSNDAKRRRDAPVGMLEWLGIDCAEEFDQHAFDADEINMLLGGRVGVT